jgi:hypothetical protein
MSATYDFAQRMTSPVQTMLDEQRRTAARMMSSFGPSATMTKAADIHATAGLVAKGSVMGEPFGLPKSLDAQNVAAGIMRVQEELDERQRMQDKLSSFGLSATVAGAVDVHGNFGTVAKAGWMPDTAAVTKSWQPRDGVASAVKDTLADHRRTQDRMMKSLGPSATVAGGADIYGKLGPVAKAGWMRDTAAVTKSWQYRAGVASVVQDTLAEQQRMQDRMMKSLGPSATVAGGADIYATAGLVAKGSVVGESFGFAKSLDEAIAAQKRMEHPWTDYGAAAMGAGIHKTPGMTAAIAGYGSAARGVDQLGGFASGLVGAGLLARLDETIAGMHKGSMDLSSLITATGGIADFASSLTDVGGIARVNDEIARIERSFAIPSAATGIARTLAGSAQMARTVRGVDPFTGLAVPMGIGGYPSTSDVVGGQAMPAGGPTEPTLIVPSAAESALLLDWLRDHPSTHEQALRVCDALSGLYVFLALVEAEAHINPSPVVLQTQAWSALVLFVFQLLLRRAKPRE